MNAAITWLFDLLLAPAIRLAPMTTLLVVSVATGLAMLWVVGRTSNQAGIAASKRAIHAGLFEIRLFNDNLGAVLRALGRVLAGNLRYLAHSLVPLAWVALPLVLVVAQLQAFYGYEGLAAGTPTEITVRLRDPGAAAGRVVSASLESSVGLRVDSPAVVLPGAREILWRVVPEQAGAHTLTIRVANLALTKTVHVDGAAPAAARRSPYRVSGVLDLLLYPSEPPVPGDGPVAEIAVPYSEPGLDILGWRIHWMVVYVALSMVTAFAFAKRFGVTL